MVNELMKNIVPWYPIDTVVEIRDEAWDNVLDNGVVFDDLSNNLVMFEAYLPMLFVELLGMSVGYLKLGCRLGVLCHGMLNYYVLAMSSGT